MGLAAVENGLTKKGTKKVDRLQTDPGGKSRGANQGGDW